MYSTNLILALTGYVSLSNAHMLMAQPKPFSSPALQNGPIDSKGSNFPCQAGSSGSYAGEATVMALGSKQPLTFTGSAVHGGGSCQVSITYDTAPNPNSVWKVIHSIEGGCPAKDTPGNLPENPTAADPYTYSFAIPDDIPAGNATLAWTWLNKIGNREFYMNCAPVSLTGNGGNKENWEALPDMLVANIGNGCSTDGLEGKDYKYPNPGKSVENFATSPLAEPVGSCGAKSNSDSGGGSGDGSNGGSGSSSSPSTTAPAAATTNAPSGGGGGIFITAPVTDSPTTSAPASPAQTGGGSSGGESDSGSGGSDSGGSGSSGAGSACSTDGMWNCVDGKSYQQCAAGVWTSVMSLAAGTVCDVGQSTSLNIKAAGKKMRRLAVRFRG